MNKDCHGKVTGMSGKEFVDTFCTSIVEQVCKKADTTLRYFRTRVYDRKPFGWETARRLENASNGILCARMLMEPPEAID